MKFIYKYKSPNFNKRKKGTSVNFVILHYTAFKDSNKALKHLCEKKNIVSAHFLINKSGKIYYLVNTCNRAWHAGKSYWKGFSDINSISIGIELDNSGHHNIFENYTSLQIKSLIELLTNISISFAINKHNILGHSDIAPYRKIDPGEKFPWKKLAKVGLSFIPKKLVKNKVLQIEKRLNLSCSNNKKERSLFMLNKIGYNVKPAVKNKKKYNLLIKAYQTHYIPNLITGDLDSETYNRIQFHYNKLLT